MSELPPSGGGEVPRRLASDVVLGRCSGAPAVAVAAVLATLWTPCLALAQPGAASMPASSSPAVPSRSAEFGVAASGATPAWIAVPKIDGRLTARELGLVINTADPYSVEVGEFYVRARRLAATQVLRIELPLRPNLSVEEFEMFEAAVASFFGPRIQALALAWTVPYAVSCNSITGALALGFDSSLCEKSCAASRRSPYFDSATGRPFTDLRMRPSMLLAAPDVDAAKALIRRGVASDRSLGLRGAPPVNVYFATTADKARSVRSVLFPPPGLVRRAGIDVHVETTQAVANVDRVVLYQTGLANVDKLETVRWVPGALADHLTSTGGQLVGGGQMSVLAWISSGATATYGTVSEPCNHLQKFPHPQIVLLNYVQGSSAIEAYWKSVAWPQQGLFVGEPLAAPFARR